jgi:hypothetical protein
MLPQTTVSDPSRFLAMAYRTTGVPLWITSATANDRLMSSMQILTR